MPTRGSVAPRQTDRRGGPPPPLDKLADRMVHQLHAPTWRPTKLLALNRARAADVAALAGVNPAFDRVPWVSNSQFRE
jgi:hypothetical protein